MPTVLDQLLEHVVHPDVLDAKDQYGWAPLHILAQNQSNAKDKCDMMSMLIECAADPNVRGNRGATPLFKAAATSATSQLQVLLSLGVDPNEANDEGTTPLDTSWHNRACRDIIHKGGGCKGGGVSGKGRTSRALNGGSLRTGARGPWAPRGPRTTHEATALLGAGRARRQARTFWPLGDGGVGAKPAALAVPAGSARARGTASRTSSRPRAATTAGRTGRATRPRRARARAAARRRARTRRTGHGGQGG